MKHNWTKLLSRNSPLKLHIYCRSLNFSIQYCIWNPTNFRFFDLLYWLYLYKLYHGQENRVWKMFENFGRVHSLSRNLREQNEDIHHVFLQPRDSTHRLPWGYYLYDTHSAKSNVWRSHICTRLYRVQTALVYRSHQSAKWSLDQKHNMHACGYFLISSETRLLGPSVIKWYAHLPFVYSNHFLYIWRPSYDIHAVDRIEEVHFV